MKEINCIDYVVLIKLIKERNLHQSWASPAPRDEAESANLFKKIDPDIKF